MSQPTINANYCSSLPLPKNTKKVPCITTLLLDVRGSSLPDLKEGSELPILDLDTHWRNTVLPSSTVDLKEFLGEVNLGLAMKCNDIDVDPTDNYPTDAYLRHHFCRALGEVQSIVNKYNANSRRDVVASNRAGSDYNCYQIIWVNGRPVRVSNLDLLLMDGSTVINLLPDSYSKQNDGAALGVLRLTVEI